MEMLSSVILGLFLAACFLYRFLMKNRGFFKEQNVPEFDRNLEEADLDFELDLERSRKFGPVYGHYYGGEPVLFVGDPELLEDLLDKNSKNFPYRPERRTGDALLDNLTSFKRGEDSKRIRKMISQAFPAKSLKEVVEVVFEDCVKTLLQNFRIAAEKETAVDLKRFYGAFAIDAMVTAAFSLQGQYNKPDNNIIRLAKTVEIPDLKLPVSFFQFCFGKFRKTISIRDDTNEFRQIIVDIIQEKIRSGEKRNDFLQVILDYKAKQSTFVNSNGDLLMKELVPACVSFVLGGYDNPASALTFATYLLALNQDVQKTLREEVDTQLERNNGHLTYDVVNSMTYLDKVIWETLRMYPPAFRLARQAAADCKLGDAGITIRKGMVIIVPVYALHRNPKYWPNPDTFDPERFAPDEKKKRHKFCYLPFGYGLRKCIGQTYALLLLKFCIAHVIRHFKINTCSETTIPLEFLPFEIGFLKPKEIKVSLVPRNL